MDFLINRDDIMRALNRVAGIVEKKSTTPILSAVLIQAGDGVIKITATDKAMTYLGTFVANVNIPGEIAVDAANLLQIVKVLPSGVVSFVVGDNDKVNIRCGKSTYKLAALNAADYPPMPSFGAEDWLNLDAKDLRVIIDQTSFSIAPDDNRYGLNGAHLDSIETPVGKYLRMVGTDGNRLSWSQTLYEGTLAIGKRMLMPRKGIQELRRLIDGTTGKVEIGFGERAAVVRFEGTLLHMRLLEAEFPNYREVLPTSFKRTATVECTELLDALRRVAIFAVDGSHSFRCDFGNDTLTMTARRLDVGDAREELALTGYTGEPLSTGFNITFLQEALKAAGNGRVLIRLGDALSPVIITPANNDGGVEDIKEGCLFVVMPVRLDG